MINILSEKVLRETLAGLRAETEPRFGMMSPQHMLEHLSMFFRFSNGKEPQRRYFTAEQESMIKEVVLSSKNMPIGFKSPVLPKDVLLELKNETFEMAIEELIEELNDFKAYFQHNPMATAVNPALGDLNHEDWLMFHQCHVVHHFSQFSLI